MAASEESVSMAQIAARAASDKIASDIVVLDVSGQLVITDCFVVCSGDNVDSLIPATLRIGPM